MTTQTFWPDGMTLTGRMSNIDHRPAMQNMPLSFEEKILRALRGGQKTFSQLEMGTGGLDPAMLASPEVFADKLDKKLRELMACGKVRLVARKPVLVFEIGTVLDRLVKELELDDE